MNRRVREPYARWCERRTPLNFGRSRLLEYTLFFSLYQVINVILKHVFSVIF
jgi:hypothetical protein